MSQNLTPHETIPALTSSPDNSSAMLGGVAKPTSKVETLPVKASMPFLRVGKPASSFRQLRKIVIESTGVDFLAVCADMMRDKNYHSTKVGVADRSRHKCGDAFDYDQTNKNIVVVSEPHGVQQYFRTWLRCKQQDGTQGILVILKDIRGYNVKGFYFDFTAAAERMGWQRIPAWKGWSLKGSGYNKMEFWHYQNTEGLSWEEAMRFLYNDTVKTIADSRKAHADRTLGLNDRGSAVRNLQEKLSRVRSKSGHFYLPRNEVDGVFGKVTEGAVIQLQLDYGLEDDGLFGPNTRELLELLS